MRRRNEEYLVALDVGTSTTRCGVACWRPDGSLVLEGYGRVATAGVSKGLVLDATAATESVRAAIEMAARRAQVKVYSVFVSVATPFARGFNSRGCIGIAREDKIIRGNDARRALAAARKVSLPTGRAVLDVYDQGFAVDDTRGVRNPVGLAGARLEAEVLVVTDSLSAQNNLAHVVRRAGYRLDHCVFGPVAAANAVLSDEEKQLGGAFVDVGATTTSVVLFAAGAPRFCRVVPIGSQHITNDLAIGLNISVDEAEDLKRRYGIPEALPARGEPAESAAGGERKVPLPRLALIVRARVEEIFEIVATELDRSGHPAAASARVVLAGGFCRLPGGPDAARRVLRRPVRIAAPEIETTMSQFNPDPTHAVLIGTLWRGAWHHERKLDRRFDDERWFRNIFRKVAGWL